MTLASSPRWRKAGVFLVMTITAVLCIATPAEEDCFYAAEGHITVYPADGPTPLNIEAEGERLVLTFEPAARLEVEGGLLPQDFGFGRGDDDFGPVTCPSNFAPPLPATGPSGGESSRGAAGATGLDQGHETCTVELSGAGTLRLQVVPLGERPITVSAKAGILRPCSRRSENEEYGVHVERVQP